MIMELCKYMVEDDEDGIPRTPFVIGSTLFALAVDSDTIDECVVVAESAPGLVDGLLVDYRQIPLVVYSRAKTRFTARDNAYTVFDLLQSTTGKIQVDLPAIGSGPIYTCNFECRTPYYTGLDESGRRYVFAMPVDVTVTNMT